MTRINRQYRLSNPMRVQNKNTHTYLHSSTHFFLSSFFFAALQISFTTHLICDGLVKSEMKKKNENESNALIFFSCCCDSSDSMSRFACSKHHLYSGWHAVVISLQLALLQRDENKFSIWIFLSSLSIKRMKERTNNRPKKGNVEREREIEGKTLKKYRFKHLINIFLGDSTMEQAHNTHTRHMIRNDNSSASIHGKEILRSRKIK